VSYEKVSLFPGVYEWQMTGGPPPGWLLWKAQVRDEVKAKEQALRYVPAATGMTGAQVAAVASAVGVGVGVGLAFAAATAKCVLSFGVACDA
jgi:hypothetical protein